MDDAQRSRLRSLLLRLVMPTEDGDPVRARVPRAKVAVDDAHVRLVEQLVDARLVSIDGDTVQIAHEALVRVWPRLRGWLDDDVDGQRLFRHLAGAADAWDAMGRPDSELYRGARLSPHPGVAGSGRARTSTTPRPPSWTPRPPCRRRSCAPREERIRRERRVNRRLRGALAGVGVLAVLALVAGVLAVRSSDRAEGRPRPGPQPRPTSRTPGGRAPWRSSTRTCPPRCCSRCRRSRSTPPRRPGTTSPRCSCGRRRCSSLPRSRRVRRRSDGQPRRRVARGEPAGGGRRSVAARTPPPSNPCRSRTTSPPAASPSRRTAACWRWR